ncbi:hypothetical protein OIU74_016741 [Salix koriyanagi]|uniref:Uncharacterized protein n=1 Tax=Salix koriyanagi TaxID=2511006 RepID=A0A9Q0SSI2_9ROSI|nr:hypothetical protein OIU74_016741 [Salix koriyanagi]
MKRQREAVENRGIIGIDRDREVERGIIGSEAEAEVERGIIGVEAEAEAETGIEMERGEGTGDWREEAAVVIDRQERVEGRRRGVMVWKGREEGRIRMVALIIRGRLKVMRKW